MLKLTDNYFHRSKYICMDESFLLYYFIYNCVAYTLVSELCRCVNVSDIVVIELIV